MPKTPERAAFGVYPQLQGKRSKQDREAAKNFPVDLARGALAGALGIPGDIESLARLPYELYTGNDSPTILPTSEDILKRIPFGSDTPASQFAAGIGTLAGGSANLGALPRAVKATPGALKAAARNLSTPRTLNPQAGVFIGPKAKTFHQGKADMAVAMEEAGRTPEEIWLATGTFRGADGILRQEIDDRAAKFLSADERKERIEAAKGKIAEMKEKIKPTPQKDLFPKALTEAKKEVRDDISILKSDVEQRQNNPRTQGLLAQHIFEHPELYQAYPELQNIKIVTEGGSGGGARGSLSIMPSRGFYPGSMEMDIYDNGLRSNPTSTALHEMQHAIQTLEGMGPGGNPTFAFANPEAHEILKKLREETYKPSTFEQFQRVNKFPEDEAQAAYEQYVKERKANPITSDKIERAMQETAAMEYYKRLLGEAEARAVQDRQLMTPSQRMETPPPASYDVPQEDLIVKPPREYADGGRVHFSDNPDVMMLELAGGGLVKGLKAAAKAAKAVKAPQEDAMRLAQQRAALPKEKGGLGLPANNTPEQRAKAMGINTDAYHGSKQDITGAFKPGYDDNLAFVTKSPEFANKWIGKGKYTQRSGEQAQKEVKSAEDVYREIRSRNMNYDDALERMKGEEFDNEYDRRRALAMAEAEREFGTPGNADKIHSTVYPLKVEANRTFNPETDMDVMAEFFERNEIPPKLQELYAGGNYMMYETKPVVEYLKSKGYDSMRLRESTGDDYPTIAVFNPETTRSRFAAFDPFRKDVATATAMGVAAPDLLAKESDDEQKAAGGEVHMQAGGIAKAIKAAKAAKEAPMKASEALGRIEGRPLVITQADRTKVGGGFLGGPGFSGLQLEDPAYRAAEAAWAVKNPGTAKTILGGRGESKDAVYAAMLGTPTQHQSNQMVFDKLLGDFKRAAKRGELDPVLRDKINVILANSVNKDGVNIFPPDVDILDKNFKNLASTFDRRSVTASLIGGTGVGGKKGQIIDYDKVIRQTTDPMLLDKPTGALGNRLFTLSGGIIDRPDLHPAFPTILQGEDLGVSFDPVARELIMKDFAEKIMREKGRKPGYMDYTKGYPPSQLITEDLLTELQKMGKKAGGAVRKAAGGEITADDLILEERKL